MAIHRNKSPKQYTNIDNSILKNPNLTLKERGMLVTLLSLPDNWKFSMKGLEKILPDGQSSIKSSLRRLEELGYLKRSKVKNEKGQFGTVTWEVYEVPCVVGRELDNPCSEKPSLENPIVEKPQMQDPIQSIKKESITNEYNIYSFGNHTKRNNIQAVGFKSKNRFDNFTQRSYSTEDYRMMEKILLSK